MYHASAVRSPGPIWRDWSMLSTTVFGFVAGLYGCGGPSMLSSPSSGAEAPKADRVPVDTDCPRCTPTGLERDEYLPAIVPDSTPQWFSDDSSYADGGAGYLRTVVGVEFMPGTSLMMKRAAVGRVGGHFVGGVAGSTGSKDDPPSDGAYYLRIPGAESRGHLRQAVRLLRGRPEVLNAMLICDPDGCQ